ncbi:GNAT family N-acetyltransferase [Sandaracinus amylolyticus]|nr:GNAT family N-acetyltransferase [Sandaracinus amylolyticus]
MHHIREIDPTSDEEIEIVARRMRETLVEVLGAERGTAMYTMEWLRDRVRFHLDPARSTAVVYLAEDASGHVTGHTIVRLDVDEAERPVGLFSTTFVEPACRRSSIASELLRRGEAWIREQRMPRAITYTDEHNVKLIRLYEKHGYTRSPMGSAMVQLAKPLDA